MEENNPYNINRTIDLAFGSKKTSDSGFSSNNSVQFGDSKYSYGNNYSNSFQGGVLAKLVMKFSGGAVKTSNQAQLVLLGIMALAIIVTMVMIFKGGSGGSSADAKKAKEQMNKMNKMLNLPPLPNQPQ